MKVTEATAVRGLGHRFTRVLMDEITLLIEMLGKTEDLTSLLHLGRVVDYSLLASDLFASMWDVMDEAAVSTIYEISGKSGLRKLTRHFGVCLGKLVLDRLYFQHPSGESTGRGYHVADSVKESYQILCPHEDAHHVCPFTVAGAVSSRTANFVRPPPPPEVQPRRILFFRDLRHGEVPA